MHQLIVVEVKMLVGLRYESFALPDGLLVGLPDVHARVTRHEVFF